MGYIIELKTTQTAAIKIVIDAINSLLTDANFVFYPNNNDSNNCGGIVLKEVNKTGKILVYMRLHADKFDVYNYNYGKDSKALVPEYKTKYLGNFLDLDESSLSILKEIKKKYTNNDYMFFLHNTKTLRFYCLHFHIIKKGYYKRVYPKTETGIYMIQDMFIDEVINNLTSNINYYKMINYNFLKST